MADRPAADGDRARRCALWFCCGDPARAGRCCSPPTATSWRAARRAARAALAGSPRGRGGAGRAGRRQLARHQRPWRGRRRCSTGPARSGRRRASARAASWCSRRSTTPMPLRGRAALGDLDPAAYRPSTWSSLTTGTRSGCATPALLPELRLPHRERPLRARSADPAAGRLDRRPAPPPAAIECDALPAGVSMLTAHDLNDLASARIRRYLPRFQSAPPPDPARDDWDAWIALLADRATDDGDPPARWRGHRRRLRHALQLPGRAARRGHADHEVRRRPPGRGAVRADSFARMRGMMRLAPVNPPSSPRSRPRQTRSGARPLRLVRDPIDGARCRHEQLGQTTRLCRAQPLGVRHRNAQGRENPPGPRRAALS